MTRIETILAGTSTVILLAGALSCTGVMASHVLQTQVVNKLHTDTVDISLSSVPAENTLIIDDSQVNQRVSISNKGLACWIRVKAGLTAGSKQSASTPKGVEDSSWKEGGDGYLYRSVPLEEDGSLNIDVPVYDPREAHDSACALLSDVTVEAVQVENLTPDFSAQNPWGSTTPEVCLHTREEGTE